MKNTEVKTLSDIFKLSKDTLLKEVDKILLQPNQKRVFKIYGGLLYMEKFEKAFK